MTDQAHLRRPPTSGPSVARRDGLIFLSLVVAVNAWALFPSPDESGGYTTLPDATRAAAKIESALSTGANRAVDSLSSVNTEFAQFMNSTVRMWTGALSSPGTAVASDFSGVLADVPLKAKLQGLFGLLMSETDDVARAALLTKLQALLSLPDYVLAQVLQHPDLADFNRMLDAALLGQTELWWLEYQLSKVDVIPVTTTTDRIDVSGKPAFLFDSAAETQADNGGPSTPALKTLSVTPSQSPAAPMVMSAPLADPGVAAFSVPTASEPQLMQLSVGVPEIGAVPVATPSPAPVSVPAPAPATVVVSVSAPAPTTAVSPDPVVASAGVPPEPSEAPPSTQPAAVDNSGGVDPATKPPEPSGSSPSVNDDATRSTSQSVDDNNSGSTRDAGTPGNDSNNDSGESGSPNP